MNKEIATDLAMLLFETPGVKSIRFMTTGEVVINNVAMALTPIAEERGSLHYWRELGAVVSQIKGVLEL